MSTMLQRAKVAARSVVGIFSEESMTQAYGMLRGVLPGGMGTPPTRGTQEFLRAYSEMPWLRAVAGRIATSVATAGWELFVLKGKGDKRARWDGTVQRIQRAGSRLQRKALLKQAHDADDLTEVLDHPLLDVLHSANSFQTGLAMRKVTQLHLDLAGDAFWLKERDAQGTVVGVWPVPPHWIQATPTPAFRFYRVSFKAWRGIIPDTEFVWFSDDDPLNPYARGSGIARALTDELETDEYASKYCHDDQTECLTRRGWVRGLDLLDTDEVATWNETTQRTEYQRPLHITRAKYSGEMHHWRGDSADACVTPNHRLWVLGKTYGRQSGKKRKKGVCEWPKQGAFWHFEESREAMSRPGRPFFWREAGYYDGPRSQVKIPAIARVTKRKPGSRGGGRPPKFGVNDPLTFDALSFAAFLGYYVSEGSPDKRGLCIAQSKGEYIDDIRRAMNIFPAEWVSEKYIPQRENPKWKPAYRWCVRHHGLAEWFKVHVGHGAANKRLPAEVFEWPVAAKRELLRTLINGDGSWYTGGGAAYFSISSGLVEDVQRLCVDVGWSAVTRVHRGNHHAVHIRTEKSLRRLIGAKSAVAPGRGGQSWADVVPYDGVVWCVTVPNEKFFSRRNGCVMLGGNTKSFFYNSGQPPIMIWPKGGNMTEGNVKRLEEDWLSKTQGFWKAFKPYFLSREVEVKELDAMGSFRSQQLVQIREHERSTIMQVFGIPPEILGVLAQSNRSTIDASSYHMARYVVEPRLEFLRSVLQERLVPEYDERLILEYVSQVDDDPAAQLQAATAAPYALSIDEWRKLAGHKPLEDAAAGNQHMVPFNLQPLDLALEPPPPAPTFVLPPNPPAPGLPPAAVDGDVDDDTEDEEEDAETQAAASKHHSRGTPALFQSAELTSIRGAVKAALLAGDESLAEDLEKAATLDVDALPMPSAIAARQEPGLARALARTWRDHAARVDLAKLERALGPIGVVGDAVALLAPETLAQAQTGVLQPQLVRGFLRGAEVGGRQLQRVGVPVRGLDGGPVEKPGPVAVDFAAVNPRATAWARAHAGALVQAPAAVRDTVRRLTVRANQEGIPPRALARLLRDTVGLTDAQVEAVANFRQRLADDDVPEETLERRVERYAAAQGRARSLNIARTELQSALNQGQQALWQEAVDQQAIVASQFEQVFLIADDDRLCPECEALADATAAIGGTFPGGTSGPPVHPSCRCAVGLQNATKSAAGPRKRRRTLERDADGFITGVMDEEMA